MSISRQPAPEVTDAVSAETESRELAVPTGQAGSEGSESVAGSPSNRWTFLTNHSHVLIALQAKQDLSLREVASQVGITERAVQRIIQDLEEDGFITREKVGRKNRYEVNLNQPLRHPLEAHRNIGDLLRLING